jgi:hypothetical protein
VILRHLLLVTEENSRSLRWYLVLSNWYSWLLTFLGRVVLFSPMSLAVCAKGGILGLFSVGFQPRSFSIELQIGFVSPRHSKARESRVLFCKLALLQYRQSITDFRPGLTNFRFI